jgi:hypothetical protein
LHNLPENGVVCLLRVNKPREYGDINFGKQIARYTVTGNGYRVSIRRWRNKGDKQVSLCWQNVDPLENSPSGDTFRSPAGALDAGTQSEATHAIARLLDWYRRVFSGSNVTGMKRIRTTSK